MKKYHEYARGVGSITRAKPQRIDKCRLCYSEELEPVISLGQQFVSNFVDPKDGRNGIICPIELVLCSSCSLVQQLYTAPQEFLYSRYYWYRSGVTDTMRQHLAEIADIAEKLGRPSHDDVILDIGSNDGTLLRSYKCPGIKVGVEPAINLAEEGRQGLDHFINGFWGYEEYMEKARKRAKIITAIGMFYDLDDPNRFIGDISKALEPDGGIFIAQMMGLKQTIQNWDIGNFCHEHLEFYTVKSICRLLERHGLRLFDIQENKVNGGSYRFYACHARSWRTTSPRVDQAIGKEMTMGLNWPQMYKEFMIEVVGYRNCCASFIKQELEWDKTVAVYGASTKGNVILQWYGIRYPDIKIAADRSSEKWGKVTIGTEIPITSEDVVRDMKPNYLLVLPYAFIDEFVQREDHLLRQGTKFIVPLPKPRLVGLDASGKRWEKPI